MSAYIPRILSLSPMWALIALTVGYIVLTLAMNWRFYRGFWSCYRQGHGLSCFDDAPSWCDQVREDSMYGWCLDPENEGAFVGDMNGSHEINCKHWIKDGERCPPRSCSGKFPHGVQKDKDQLYGWCLDDNRPYRGSACGPDGNVTCKNWVWKSQDCAKCNRDRNSSKSNHNLSKSNHNLSKSNRHTKTPLIQQPGKCSTVCGYMSNGSKMPCPPPSCAVSTDHAGRVLDGTGKIISTDKTIIAHRAQTSDKCLCK